MTNKLKKINSFLFLFRDCESVSNTC